MVRVLTDESPAGKDPPEGDEGAHGDAAADGKWRTADAGGSKAKKEKEVAVWRQFDCYSAPAHTCDLFLQEIRGRPRCDGCHGRSGQGSGRIDLTLTHRKGAAWAGFTIASKRIFS